MFSPSSKFRPSSPSPTLDKSYATFLNEYIRSDTDTRLDLLQSTRNVDGLAFHSDDSICALSLLEWDRTKDGKMIFGASGQPSDYYIFQVAAAQVVANFGSFAVHHTKDPLPAEVDWKRVEGGYG